MSLSDLKSECKRDLYSAGCQRGGCDFSPPTFILNNPLLSDQLKCEILSDSFSYYLVERVNLGILIDWP